mmetsp:Transcript_4930/g.12710  ORF Transcript_4930/g.12710 Transcript_4930/m.12710 type:complete len:235 (+) Transcript_4930:590-1294(+)
MIDPVGRGGHRHEGAGVHGHSLAGDADVDGRLLDGGVEPVYVSHHAALVPKRWIRGGLAAQVVHVPPGPEQGPRHLEHASVGPEERVGQGLAVENHQGLVLAVGGLAELGAAPHHPSGDVRKGLEVWRRAPRGAAHELREAASRVLIEGRPLHGRCLVAHLGLAEDLLRELLLPGGVAAVHAGRGHASEELAVAARAQLAREHCQHGELRKDDRLVVLRNGAALQRYRQAVSRA